MSTDTALGVAEFTTIALAVAALVASGLALAARGRRIWLVLAGAGVIVAGILAAALIPRDGAPNWATVALAVAFATLGTIGGSPAVALVLRLATHGSVELGAHGGILVSDRTQPTPRTREVLRGGATIGYLERIALIGAVLAGQAVAIAVIVAVKGLGRFSELETSEARERFIIGTLASLIWAGAAVAATGVGW
jgi:hypothetical protein